MTNPQECGGRLPIETAPKDGTRFLVYEGFEPTQEQAYFDSEGELWPCTNRSAFWQRPTHWRPLLPSPTPP